MTCKIVKYGIISSVSLLVVGTLLFGADVFSYAKTSINGVRKAVKDNVPVDVELRRARDLLDEIMPQMHANIQLIAQEEVEVEQLKADIAASHQRVAHETNRVAHLRNLVDSEQVAYTTTGRQLSEAELTEQLARRFDHLKEAQMVLAGKEKLLEARQKSLETAIAALDKTRGRKALLEQRIEALETRYRMLKAAGAGSKVAELDDSKLAQTERVIADIRKRLDTNERVLAHEARFTDDYNVEIANERDVLGEVDEFLGRSTSKATENDETVELTVPLSRN